MSGDDDEQPNRLRLPIRHYQIARLYGPGMPAAGDEGLHEKQLDAPAGQVGLVCVHCWNLGESTGPYPIGPDAHCPGEAADWVPTAHEIIANYIKPAVDAARAAGVAVFHLAQSGYAPKYPQYLKIAVDPALQPPGPQQSVEGCVRPWSVEERRHDLYGADFPGPAWRTHADRFDIAQAVRPLPHEEVFLDGWQLNGLCRRMDIDTLFYMGFMADVCLVNVPGALREMATKFRYRCVVLRECTTAYEFPETYDGRWMTHAAIRVIEMDLGYSASARDFVAACRAGAQ
ncbi:MAG TPA: hypothetical protein VKV57_12030 [bacterium]|nr:hypothetical protein [bacterium]